VDDALPPGAVAAADGGDTWEWSNINPTPNSGTFSHQSAATLGFREHYFDNATTTLTVNTGNVLFVYVYLDPLNVPSEVMLMWNDGQWEHRAYWGADSIAYGIAGTASRRYMGLLPTVGRWTRLEVPASQVGLEGRILKGMCFAVYGGRVAWDSAGVRSD
jgi:hypothetical protein